MVSRALELGGLGALLAILVLVGAIALVVEVSRRARTWWRHRAVARELAAVGLQTVPLRVAVPRCRRSDVVRPEVQPVRDGEPRDPGAAKVLAFRIHLEKRGYYVDELQIQRRIH